MSTISNNDLFLIQRGGTNYKVTAQDVGTYSATNALPSQSGQNGKFLTTNGTTTSWAPALSTITGNNGINATTSSGAVTVGVQSQAAICWPSQRFLVPGPISLGGPGETSSTGSPFGSITVTFPAGATKAILWHRVQVNTVPANTTPSSLTAGQGLSFEINLSGASFDGYSNTAVDGNNAGSISQAGRGWSQSQFFVRSDQLILPVGPTSFTVSANVTQVLGIQAYNVFANWQMTFQPFTPIS